MQPSEQPQSKKRCTLRRLERMIELIENGNYVWQWAHILRKLLSCNSSLILLEDYQPLLHMLTKLQPVIKFSNQALVFNDIVRIMMSEESRLKANGTIISHNFCVEHWDKVMQMALKKCAASNDTAEQNVQLLQIMIENNYIVSYAFIETIIKEILSYTIKKTSASVYLMTAIFQNINIDLLTTGNEIKASVIAWLSPKINASELMRTIGNKMDIDIVAIAELYVLCVLCKTEKLTKLSFEHAEPMKANENTFDTIIANLKSQFSYQIFDSLIAVDCSRDVDRFFMNKIVSTLPEANSIDVVLNEGLYAELEKELNPDDHFNPSNDATCDFEAIASSLSIYVNILNQFLAYKAFDHTKYAKSFISKRIALKIGQLNSIMERIVGCVVKDQFDILEKLNSIWKFGWHRVLERLIFEQDCNKKLINWLGQQLLPQFRPCSQPPNRISLTDLPIARKMQYNCLLLLTRFATFSNGNGESAFLVIKDFDIDVRCNENLFIMFELVRVNYY